MRGVGVCVVAAVAAVLAIGGPRPSFADIQKEPAVAQNSDDEEQDEECEENTQDQDCNETTEIKESNEGHVEQHTPVRSKAASQPAIIERDLIPEQLLFFSGSEIWRNGLFSHTGVFWAYQGLGGDGPVLKLLLNSGLYRYTSGRKEIVGFQTMGAFLPGWRWHGPGLEFTVFAGLDLQDHRFLPNDPGNRLRGTHAGVRGGFDVWYEPVRNGMVTMSASLSTVGSSYWMRAATGARVLDMIWIGPEFIAAGDNRYTEMRLGGHITSFHFSSYEFSLGAGWAKDNDGRSGAYGRLGVLYRPYGGASYAEQPVPF
jgi:hypothetical protein